MWLLQMVSGCLLPVLLAGAGVYFWVSAGRYLLRHPRTLVKGVMKVGDGSAARSLAVALAGTLGVGNIAGVATALVLGGAGAVFWMWISALLAMMLKYAEVALARRCCCCRDGRMHGGAMYYIKEAFGGGRGRMLAALFALLCLLCSFTLGGVIQSNAAAGAMADAFGCSPLAVGAFLGGAAAVLSVWGRERVERACAFLVPFVCLLFAVAASAVLVLRRAALPAAISAIFKGAFSWKSGVGGMVGFFTSGAVRYGVLRGLISNEAGCGTATIAHATARTASPAAQGMWGILEVLVDTLVLCTMTALAILVSGVPLVGEDGITLALAAFGAVLGDVAAPMLALSVLLFAFATLLCWSHYGAECLLYLTGRADCARRLAPVVLICSVLGAVAAPAVLWEITDLIVAAMAILNIAALLRSRRTVNALTRDFLYSHCRRYRP